MSRGRLPPLARREQADLDRALAESSLLNHSTTTTTDPLSSLKPSHTGGTFTPTPFSVSFSSSLTLPPAPPRHAGSTLSDEIASFTSVAGRTATSKPSEPSKLSPAVSDIRSFSEDASIKMPLAGKGVVDAAAAQPAGRDQRDVDEDIVLEDSEGEREPSLEEPLALPSPMTTTTKRHFSVVVPPVVARPTVPKSRSRSVPNTASTKSKPFALSNSQVHTSDDASSSDELQLVPVVPVETRLPREEDEETNYEAPSLSKSKLGEQTKPQRRQTLSAVSSDGLGYMEIEETARRVNGALSEEDSDFIGGVGSAAAVVSRKKKGKGKNGTLAAEEAQKKPPRSRAARRQKASGVPEKPEMDLDPAFDGNNDEEVDAVVSKAKSRRTTSTKVVLVRSSPNAAASTSRPQPKPRRVPASTVLVRASSDDEVHPSGPTKTNTSTLLSNDEAPMRKRTKGIVADSEASDLPVPARKPSTKSKRVIESEDEDEVGTYLATTKAKSKGKPKRKAAPVVLSSEEDSSFAVMASSSALVTVELEKAPPAKRTKTDPKRGIIKGKAIEKSAFEADDEGEDEEEATEQVSKRVSKPTRKKSTTADVDERIARMMAAATEEDDSLVLPPKPDGQATSKGKQEDAKSEDEAEPTSPERHKHDSENHAPKPAVVSAAGKKNGSSKARPVGAAKHRGLAGLMEKKGIWGGHSPGLSNRAKIPRLHMNLKPPPPPKPALPKVPVKKKKGDEEYSDEDKPWYETKHPDDWDSDDRETWAKIVRKREKGWDSS